MSRLQKHFLLPSLFAVAVAVPALAQPSGEKLTAYPPNNPARCEQTKDVDVAQSHFVIGEKAYQKGDFETAAKEILASYEADCTKHDLLVILSRAHERASTKDASRHLHEAAYALEVYLDRVRDDPGARERREQIARLKKAAAEADAKAKATATATATVTTTPPAERKEHTVAPWIVTGVGGAVLLGGAITWGVGNANKPTGCEFGTGACNKTSYPSDPANGDPDVPDPSKPNTLTNKRYQQAQQDAGNAKGLAVAGVVMMGVGAVGVLGGLVWHFLEPTDAPSTTGKVKPALSSAAGPGYAGLQLGGSF